MRFGLRNRHILVTGATGHLGKTITRMLAAERVSLYLTDMSILLLEDLRAEILTDSEVDVTVVECDFRNAHSRLSLVSRLMEEAPHLDGIVHNAAFVGSQANAGWATGFQDQSLDFWESALSINLTAPFHITQSLLPLVQKSKSASIVSIGSIYGKLGPDWGLYEGVDMGNPAAYAVSKAGLSQLTRWLATSISDYARANTVSPGGVYRNQEAEFVRRYVSRTPLRRMASEIDVAHTVLFLLSEHSSYITGQDILVDGGYSAW